MSGGDESGENWAVEPCSRKWTLGMRPCAWFTYGKECERSWSELCGWCEMVMLGAMEANVVAAFLWLCFMLRASRSARGGRWNDFELMALYCTGGTVAQMVAYVDPEGSSRRLPPWVKFASKIAIRLCFDMALFQLSSAYHDVLDDSRMMVDGRRSDRVLLGGAFMAAYHGTFYAVANVAVPQRAYPACTHRVFGAVWHFGSGIFEATSVAVTMMHAFEVRSRLMPVGPCFGHNERVRRGILRQLVALFCIIVLFFLYSLLFLLRDTLREGAYECRQPECSCSGYLGQVLWGWAWIVVTWCAVIALVVTARNGPHSCCCCFPTFFDQFALLLRSSSLRAVVDAVRKRLSEDNAGGSTRDSGKDPSRDTLSRASVDDLEDVFACDLNSPSDLYEAIRTTLTISRTASSIGERVAPSDANILEEEEEEEEEEEGPPSK